MSGGEKIENFFNTTTIKNIFTFLVPFTFLTVFIYSLLSFNYNASIETLEDVNYIFLREWILFNDVFEITLLYYISVILSFSTAYILFRTKLKLKNKKDYKFKEYIQKNTPDFYFSLTNYLGYGAILEAIYLSFHSDLSQAWEVVAQLYIPLNILTLICFYIIILIFFTKNKKIENKLLLKSLYIFFIGCFILSVIMMFLFGMHPIRFEKAINLIVVVIIIISLIGLIFIFMLSKKSIKTIMKNLDGGLNNFDDFYAVIRNLKIQVLFLIIANLILVGLGITAILNMLVLNQILRLTRMLFLFSVSIQFHLMSKIV